MGACMCCQPVDAATGGRGLEEKTYDCLRFYRHNNHPIHGHWL